jgi:hypothetical protein
MSAANNNSNNNNNNKYKYNNKMTISSIDRSPACNGSRDTFKEWHSLWEVFGQDNGFNEYQSIVSHPDLPVNGHSAVNLEKSEKKALNSIQAIRVFVRIFSNKKCAIKIVKRMKIFTV